MSHRLVVASCLAMLFSSFSSTLGQSTAPPEPVTRAETGTEEREPPFSYYYQGRLVVLEPSADLVAVPDGTGSGLTSREDLAASEGWQRDPASARDALARRGLTLYRVPAAARPKDASGPAAATPSALERALALGLPAQPVFELGGATKIASDEVIVGFRGPTSLDAAQRFVAAQPAALGLLDARPLFGELFVVRIANAAGGRAYAVARALARAPELAFAEPNHVLILHGDAERGSAPFRGPRSTRRGPLPTDRRRSRAQRAHRVRPRGRSVRRAGVDDDPRRRLRGHGGAVAG
ncbi:MAG: hypothetical protein MUC67_07425 [Acidobacteria bacterium]|nr:hypothetical protein [Acidobacteriota bacterium]